MDRLFGDLTRWSFLEQNCIVNNDLLDDIELDCEMQGDGSHARVYDISAGEKDPVIQNLLRRWDDAFGIRGRTGSKNDLDRIPDF